MGVFICFLAVSKSVFASKLDLPSKKEFSAMKTVEGSENQTDRNAAPESVFICLYTQKEIQGVSKKRGLFFKLV